MATAARAVMGRAYNRKKNRIDPVVRLALSIVPAAQVANGSFMEANVANFTDAQQRHSVRSKEVKTVRRRTHIETLVGRRALTPRQGQLCEWYANQHEAGFEVSTGCTADYCGVGGGGFGTMDLLARHAHQCQAREMYAQAKASISPVLVPLFERVVIGGLGLGEAGGRIRYSRLSLSFRLAVDQLERGIGHMVTER